MKLKDIVPTFRYSTIDYLNESLLLTEHVFSMIDDIDVRLKQNGLNDVEAIRILAGLLLFVRMNQGSGGVVGINSLLHDDPQSGESLGTISKLQNTFSSWRRGNGNSLPC